MRRTNVTILPIFLLYLYSCGQASEKKNNLAIIQGTSVDTFHKWINLPFAIKSVKWEIEKRNNEDGIVPGPNDWKIYAEVQCNRGEINAIEDSLQKEGSYTKDIYLDSNFIKSWFSPSTKKIFYEEGRYMRVKSLVYKINKKNIGASYFNDGWITVIDSNSVFLVLW